MRLISRYWVDHSRFDILAEMTQVLPFVSNLSFQKKTAEKKRKAPGQLQNNRPASFFSETPSSTLSGLTWFAVILGSP